MSKEKKKIILAISGDIAAGKNEMTEYIERRYSGYSYRSSGFLRDILGRLDLSETRENMQKLSTTLRECFGDGLVSHVAAYDFKKIENDLISINGIRRFSDLDELKEEFDVRLVYIESDLGKRFERIARRAENSDDRAKTLEEFKKDHAREAESRIAGLRKEADYVISNNGTLEKFYERIDEIIKIIKKNDNQG